MKKYFFASLLVLVFKIFVFSEPKPTIYGRYFPPAPSFYTSESVYISSATCQAAGNVFISTRSAFLFAVHVTSAGLGGAITEIFDARISTTGQRRVSSPINAANVNPWIFNVGVSSGLAVYNQGVTPACLNVIYSEF